MESTEYVFVLPNGSVRYEIVTELSDIPKFKEMHGAKSAMPLKIYEEIVRGKRA